LYKPVDRPLPEFFAGKKVSEDVLHASEKAEAFADDTNVTCKQKLASLRTLKNILINFGHISGLMCNLEKTCIMFIGPRDPVEAPLIEGLGFTVVNRIKV